MLNAVLWLSGICLCLAALPYLSDSTQIWKRQSLEPWQRQKIHNPNYSSPYKFLRKACPVFQRTNSNKRFYKPYFNPKFYPYYSGNPLKNLHYFNSRPFSFYSDFLDSEKLDSRRNIVPMRKIRTKPDLIDSSQDQKSFEHYSDDFFNNACLRLSKNDTMIISPSILIGRKNVTSEDNWILSNKPINVYIKKLPNTNKIFKVVKSTEINDSTTSFSKMKSKRPKNIKSPKEKLLEDDSKTCVVIEPHKCQSDEIDVITSEDTSFSLPDDYDFGECNSSCLVPCHDSTDKNLVIHPTKRKILTPYHPFICQVHLDELSPDAESTLKQPSKSCKIKERLSKTRQDTEPGVGHSLYRIKRFHRVPRHRHHFKRSCLERNHKKRLSVTTKRDKSSDYLFEPDYVNYYEYNDDDYIYPPLFSENVFDNYSMQDILDVANGNIINHKKSHNVTNRLNFTKSFKDLDLGDFYKADLSSEVPNLDDIFQNEYFESEKQSSNFKLNNSVSPLPQKKISKPYESLEKINNGINRLTTEVATVNNNCLGYATYNEGLIKNLTNELEEKVHLLTNLTLNNFISPTCRVFPKLTSPSLNSKTTYQVPTSTMKKPFTLIINVEDELPLFGSTLTSPNKAACERVNARRCVCAPNGIVNFFSDHFQSKIDPKALLKKIITYKCKSYVPIKSNYEIASDMKPRLISKKKRELIESESGPKVISPPLFDELIMRGMPREGMDFFVFPSTTVEIPCFTSDEMKLSPNVADSAMYKWSHSNLKAITDGRILEDAFHKGSLIIQDVTLGDSDNYTCKVKYIDPDSQITVKRTFVHAVKVVVLPRLALHTNVHYGASSFCDQELLEMFELYLPQQIEETICSYDKNSRNSLCSVEIHNPVCYSKNKQNSVKSSIDPRLFWRTDFQKSRWIRDILTEDLPEMEISLNYELDLTKVSRFMPEASNWTSCSPHCQQKLSLKTIEVLRDSFFDALLLPVRTKSIFFKPSMDSINIKMLTACDGGLELDEGFCVPCMEHHYSEHGKTVCLPCPPGFYQDNIGAKSCMPCPHPFRPNCFYLGSRRNFTFFMLIVTTSLLLMGFLWFIVITIRSKFSHPNKVKKCKCQTQTKKQPKLQEEKPDPLPPDFN